MTSTQEARRAVRETVEGLGGLDLVIANAVSVWCLDFLCVFLFVLCDGRVLEGHGDIKY